VQGAPGSGSNFPLRGYKLSNFEGGTRVPAFVSGGLLPPGVRGTAAAGLAGIYDWSRTFFGLAGARTPAS
jgi:arylsulfatase B